MDKEKDFVIKYYRHGSLDIKRAYRLTLDKAGRSKPGFRALTATAAVVVMLIVAGAALYLSTLTTPTTIASNAGNRVIIFADGTRITLAPHSSITYDDNCREIEMTGKAYFEIRHDNTKPFIIHDNDYIIRDIGTRLTVDEKNVGGGLKTTSVYVAEGSVSLMTKARSVIVVKNEAYQIETNRAEPRKINRALSVNEMTTWATHEFHFDNTPLSDVIADLEAYYHVDITCDDYSRRLTADFQADSLSTIVSLIEQSMGVKISIKQEIK